MWNALHHLRLKKMKKTKQIKASHTFHSFPIFCIHWVYFCTFIFPNFSNFYLPQTFFWDIGETLNPMYHFLLWASWWWLLVAHDVILELVHYVAIRWPGFIVDSIKTLWQWICVLCILKLLVGDICIIIKCLMFWHSYLW